MLHLRIRGLILGTIWYLLKAVLGNSLAGQQSVGFYSALSLLRAQVQPLVEKPRSHELYGSAKKKKKVIPESGRKFSIESDTFVAVRNIAVIPAVRAGPALPTLSSF